MLFNKVIEKIIKIRVIENFQNLKLLKPMTVLESRLEINMQ